MALCHEKHAEKLRKKSEKEFKGRVVFRGDQVKDQSGNYAVFAEQGTSSSSLASAKMLDYVARLPGNNGEDADATSAYTQTQLGGPVTWISLPRDQRPPEWARKFRDPVVILVLNLYGHPLAGLYWEVYCHKHI